LKIPQEITEKVIELADIIDIVGEHVRLTKRGRNFVGLCPFHGEKTPSFTVSPDRNIYKCFGCGKAGNAITFMTDFHGLTFVEAIETLAAKYGIQIAEKFEKDPQQVSKRELMLAALKEASLFYHSTLMKKEGKSTLDYFKSRAFSDDTIKKFLLGYSIDKYDSLLSVLNKYGFDDDVIIESGLAGRSDTNNKVFDRFRGRAMFPIRDYIGRVIGFGARQMVEDKNQGKYINSPQSSIYDKSRVLYGLYEAKNSIRSKDFVIMTEGYADTITLVQAGYENVVASSGTSLTEGQLTLLKRYTNKIYFSYDSDSAGLKAAESGASLALAQGFDVLIIRLPEGEDPDSIVRKHGADTYDYHLRHAKGFIDFKIDRFKESGLLNTPQGKSNAINNLIETVAKIPDELQHDFFIQKIASLLNLTENQIHTIYDLKGKLRNDYIRHLDSESAIVESKIFVQQNDVPDKIPLDYKYSIDEILPEEYILLKVALQGTDDLTLLFEKTDFSVDILISNTAKEIFDLILENSENIDILNSLMASEISENIKSIIIELSMADVSPSENWYSRLRIDKPEYDISRIMNDSINKLKIRKIRHQIEEVQSLIKSEPDNANHLKRFMHLYKHEKDIISIITNYLD
jgi:DNA primase